MATETRATPVLPWKTRLLVAGHIFAIDYACRSNGTVNRRLMSFFEPTAPPSAKPINGVTSSDVTVDHSRTLWFRLYTPATAVNDPKLPVILYIHGGGFSFFSPRTKPLDDFCRRLAADLPAVVVSINYRLAPEHRFPSQLDDCLDTIKYLDDKAAVLPPIADLSRCFLAGDSAGGNICHNMTVRAADQDFKRVKIAGFVAIQPFFGGEERTESELRLTNVPLVSLARTDWMWRAFLPEGSDRNHEAANVMRTDISGVNFPATIVFVGGWDPLQDWQRRYHDLLKRCGKEAYIVEYPNAIHAFYGFPELPETSLLIKEVRDFIQKQALCK